MPCPTEVTIGDNLVFSVITHDPDTGLATDADAVPTYRVYEDETTTAILTGSMAKLDDTNTTGCYSESIACTTGNGFEDGKSYTIYVSATVGTEVDACAFAFKALAQDPTDVYARLGAPVAASISADIAVVDGNVDSILADTGTDGVVLANDAITAGKFDESTAFPLKSADTGSTKVARTGADSDTLETLSDQLDTITTNVAALNASTVTLQNPVTDDGNLELVAGDSYSFTITKTTYTGKVSALSGLTTAHFAVIAVGSYDDSDTTPALAITCSFTGTTLGDGTITVVVTVVLTAAQTDALAGRPPADRFAYEYQLYLKNSTDRSTIQLGKLTMASKVAPVA